MAATRIDPMAGPWPLHDSRSSRDIEAAALARAQAPDLMERAGLSIAQLALALAPHACRVAVWVGPGHNGGDGLIAARHLQLAGKRVVAIRVSDADRDPPALQRALQQARDAGVEVLAAAGATVPADLAIDALLGLGANRAPMGAIATAIATINRNGHPVLAVDLPSGLNPDSGAALGAEVVDARFTLALLTLKPGCCTGVGRGLSGQLWLDDLGVASRPATAWLTAPPSSRPRPDASHKGSFGDVAVIGGASGMTGAAWLAARAALAAGAGRVYCSLLDEAAAADPSRPELMIRPRWWTSPPELLAATTVACGCGAGDGALLREAMLPLLTRVMRLVLDADALNLLAADASLRQRVRGRRARGQPTLITPHPLEAARLLSTTAKAIQHDRLQAAAALAQRFDCAVLLKGSGSVIAAPDLTPHINPTGNAALATAGTGDVLAGWVAGRWAQQPDIAATDIAAQAAWMHGRAADCWTGSARGGPLLAADLVDALRGLALPR